MYDSNVFRSQDNLMSNINLKGEGCGDSGDKSSHNICWQGYSNIESHSTDIISDNEADDET